MSLYGDYIAEREGAGIVENEHGFATYKVIGPECYIVDIYVVPAQRKAGMAASFADQIAQIAVERGCKYLTGSVDPTAPSATASAKVLLAYGFKLAKVDHLIWFVKGL